MFMIGSLVTGILFASYKKIQNKKDGTYSEVVKKGSEDEIEQQIVRQNSEVV